MLAVYLRVSTREQLQGYGIDSQKYNIDNYLQHNGISLDNVLYYIDEGYSASSLKRPKLQKLIVDIKNQTINKIYIYKLDRLFRSLKDQIFLFELFEEYNAELLCVTENVIQETASGRLNLNIRGAVSEWERDTIVERTLDGLTQSAIQGNFPLGKVPFGYDRKDKKLIINEEKSKVIQWIFDRLEDGLGIKTVASVLNEQGFDFIWRENHVRSIKSNKIYYGTFEHFGITLENHSPSIITEEQFNRVNNRSIETHTHDRLYSGKVVCSCSYLVCDNHTSYNEKGQLYVYYICPKCKKYYSEKRIAALIDDKYHQYVASLNMSKHMGTRIDSKQKRLVEMYINDEISTEVVIAMVEKLNDVKNQYTINRYNLLNQQEFSNLINQVTVTRINRKLMVDLKFKGNKVNVSSKQDIIDMIKKVEKSGN